MTAALVALLFVQLWRHYHPGDVAGFPADQAERLIREGIARRYALDGEPEAEAALPVDAFDGLSRAELIAYGRDRLGVEEDPPEDATEDELREALRALTEEARSADFQEGQTQSDHPAQGETVDGASLVKGAGTGTVVARRPTSKRLALPVSTAGDQLDVMDRVHLEALAKTKLGLDEIDAELTDDELRAQIRAVAETK